MEDGKLERLDVSFLGQMDYYWVAFYRFPEKYLGVKYNKKASQFLAKWEAIAQSISWWHPHQGICFICDRPSEVHMRDGVLHRDGGAALRFRDGFSVFSLGGIRVSREIAETPPEKITRDMLLKEKNVDVRREILRKIGSERFAKITNRKEIETATFYGHEYQLIDLEIADSVYGRYLFMKNPSVPDTYHCEGVPNETKTVAEAIEWRNNGIKFFPTNLT